MFFFFDLKPHIAIIGDIIQSKKLKSRNEIQNKLQGILKDINKKYSDDIASDFMITLGDEFQGLLSCGKNTMNIVSEIEVRMCPVKLRFGIGIGEITTDINRNMPLGADGPAYYNARRMIDKLKCIENKRRTSKSYIMIEADGDNSDTELLLNSILLLCSSINRKWSKRQREIIYDFITFGDNQVKTAERLGINQSSVYRGLSNGCYYAYQNAMSTVTKALSEITGD